MLSAFTARPIVELKQRDKSKIESILAFGDRLLVGLNTGSLRIYRVNQSTEENGTRPVARRPSDEAPVRPVDLLTENEKFSRRPIEQLAIIKEANLLISMSDGYVSIHDLQTYTLQEQLSKTKGATAFAVTSNIVKDSDTGVPSIVSRLAVSVKRKLLLWSWHDTEVSFDATEITLTAPARTLSWASGTNLLWGMNSGYVMVDVTSKEIHDVVGPGSIGGAPGPETGRFGGVGTAGMGYMGIGSWMPKPLATPLTEGELLLAKDINTLFIRSTGDPIERRQIPWRTAPEAVAFSYPFILALHPPSKGTLEIRNPETLSLLQTISLQSAGQLHVPPPNTSLAHAGKGFLVASDRCVWRMEATEYELQIDQLVEKGRLDEAISLLGMLEDALFDGKESRIREIKMQKAESLFRARKYRDALDLFTAVSAPPQRVIRLFPNSIACGYGATEEPKSLGNFNNGTNGVEHDASTDNISSSKDPDLGDPSTGNKPKPQQSRTSDTASIRSSRRADTGDSSDNASVQGKHSETVLDDKALTGNDLKTAVLELCSFLVDARRRIQKFISPDGRLKQTDHADQNGSKSSLSLPLETLFLDSSDAANAEPESVLLEIAKMVDTTLFRAYMFARPTLAGSLFRIENSCDPDVVKEKLLENARYNDLVDFLHGKKLHRPALEVLRRYGQADEDESAPTLRGPQRTVGYLQSLPPELIDLILEFAEWPLEKDPELGMEIFLADTENAETLPRDKVANYLQRLDSEFAVRYLEHIINELNDLTPDFHQRLITLYLEKIKSRDAENHGPGGLEPETEQRHWKNDLLEFLASSNQYSFDKVLRHLPRDNPEFYEARAIVLSKKGQHKQALEIYVFNLQDHQKAEEYCNRIYIAQDSAESSEKQSQRTSTIDDDATPSIYHLLLSLYLAPDPPHKPAWEPALDLLGKHGSRLPAYSTLNLIPETLPVQDLESYFRGRIRTANSLINQGRITGGLLETDLIDTKATLLIGEGVPGRNGGRNRRVVVWDERVCGVCHKRLGRSVISVFPE
ncbi:MAG: Vacuolar morphogenesis protein 6 [Sclerophora amabilis]|nr:MAG: Vacuolar morphogenesis protein 6 [Sclerophora amabilis]